MKRSEPLKRRTRLATRRPRARRSGRVHNPHFLAFVHTLPCAARSVQGHRCDGRIEADHAGERPVGRRADDRTCIPLCMLGHRERTDFAGAFRGFDRVHMRGWLDEQIARTQARYLARYGSGVGQDGVA